MNACLHCYLGGGGRDIFIVTLYTTAKLTTRRWLQEVLRAGESLVTWDLTIRDEGLEEKNEKLRLSLRDPVNTIIGDRRKMGLRIINAENGT